METDHEDRRTKRLMNTDPEKSLSDEATFAGHQRPQRADVSLGDERTLGDAAGSQDTILEDIEVVDLEARYRMDGTLGQGGMGAVLLATDTRLDRKVAIKRILGEAAGNRMAVNRFLTEAKSIAALNHPNIVQIYDYGRAKDGLRRCSPVRLLRLRLRNLTGLVWWRAKP
jgi:Protein kinase domain